MPAQNCFIKRAVAHDIDMQSELLQGWHQEYRQLSRGRFSGSLALARHGNMTVLQEYTNQSLHEIVVPPESHLVFGLIVNCEHPLYLDSKPVVPGQLFVLNGKQSYDLRTQGATKLVGITFERDFFIERTLGQEIAVIGNAIRHKVLDLDPHVAALLRQLGAILSSTFETAEDVWPAHIRLEILRDIAYSNIWLALNKGDQSGNAGSGSRSAERQACTVRKAIQFMRCNLASELSVADICEATHVSQRTLQYYFEHSLQISPQQYLKALRLNTARRLLKQNGTCGGRARVGTRVDTIADIAAECGFSHPSRFAGDYKRLFGELPSTHAQSAQRAHDDIAPDVAGLYTSGAV